MSNTLIARDGYVYTNGVTAGSNIALGKYDSTENWREVTIEEWERIADNQEVIPDE